MTLRPEQELAVRRTGQDVCVVAGPGSGKTRVLVERFAWLVEQGAAPDRVLAFTFTEKAATEIHARLVERFGGRPELRERIERAWVSTVHGFCARLLREQAIAAGIDPQFVVLDEEQADEELSLAAEQVLDEFVAAEPETFRGLADAVSAWDLAGSLAGVYEASRLCADPPAREPEPADFDEFLNLVEGVLRDPLAGWNENQRACLAGVREWCRRVVALRGRPAGPEHFQILASFDCNLSKLKRNNPAYDAVKSIKDSRLSSAMASLASEYFRPQRLALLGLLRRIDEVYTANKRARSALDFADLEQRAIALLRSHPAVREEIRGLFDAILMDELQDTNPLQWALVNLIRSPDRFFAVGDVNQSIYGFRHADPRAFSAFREGLEKRGHTVDRLRENHRSRAEILRAVEAIAAGRDGIEKPELVPMREFDPQPEPSVEVIVVAGENTEDLAAKEARWIARRVREIAGQSNRWRDVAVLVRKTALMSPIEEALREFGIPCAVSRGTGFFDAQEVTDLVRWLRVLDNPRDEISLASVLRSPLVGVSDETLFRMKQAGSLADALVSIEKLGLEAEESIKLERLADQLRALRPLAGYVSPDRLVARAIDDCDYEAGLNARARANLEKLLSLLCASWDERPLPLSGLLEDLEARRETAREADAPPDDTTNAVRLMSIHSAKGLEFPVVFLASLHAGVSRRQDDLCYSSEYGLGARWRLPGGTDSVADAVHQAASTQARDRESEEANRLLFVAMTRAEQHLVFSWWTHPKQRMLSKWPKYVEEALASHGSVRFLRTFETALNTFEPAVPHDAGVPVLLDRPGRAGQYDSTASVTALALFLECPRQYFLARYLGWETAASLRVDAEGELVEEDRDGMDAAQFGTAVHEWLAGQRDGPPDPEVVEFASRFERSDLGARAARATRVEREFDFILSLDDLVLRGQIDLWFEEGGELVVVDYKTDRFDAATRAERLAHYGLQLRYYAAALERMLGRTVDRSYLYLLREDVAEPVALGPQDDLIAHIRRFRAAQETLDFPLREGERCRRCPFYRGLCPARRPD
jgi:ATP-dependent exoDNAse (exonuclease V) beta subunit